MAISWITVLSLNAYSLSDIFALWFRNSSKFGKKQFEKKYKNHIPKEEFPAELFFLLRIEPP